MGQILTYFLLFGLMFFILPLGHSPFEVSKSFGAVIFIASLALVSLAASPKSLLVYIKRNLLKLFIFILLVSLASYHLFFSIYPEHLLWGNAWRPHGTMLYIGLFVLFLTTSKTYFNISIYNKLAFFSLIFLFIFTLIIGPRGSFRFIGPLGEPSSLGAAVLFLFPFAISSNKKHLSISLVCSLTLVLLSGSRAVILGFLVEALILYLRHHKKLFIFGASTLVAILLSSFILPFLPRNLPPEYFLRFEDRSQIWQVAVTAAQHSPILGTGFGSVQDALNDWGWKTNSFTRFQSIDHSHNLFLNWWIMGGITGVVILMAIIMVSFGNLYRTHSWVLFSTLIGLLIVQSFNPVSVVTLVHFWWLLGISLPNRFKISPGTMS